MVNNQHEEIEKPKYPAPKRRMKLSDDNLEPPQAMSQKHKPPLKKPTPAKKRVGGVPKREFGAAPPKKSKKGGDNMSWDKLAASLSSDKEWEKQTAACNKIKELSESHPEYFHSSDPHISDVFRELIRTANSLRSQLTRCSLTTISHIFSKLGKTLDHSIDGIIPVIIKKAGDKNAFIAEEAEKAIIEVCGQSNEVKVVLATLPLVA